jgi:hypothetical protein
MQNLSPRYGSATTNLTGSSEAANVGALPEIRQPAIGFSFSFSSREQFTHPMRQADIRPSAPVLPNGALRTEM